MERSRKRKVCEQGRRVSILRMMVLDFLNKPNPRHERSLEYALFVSSIYAHACLLMNAGQKHAHRNKHLAVLIFSWRPKTEAKIRRIAH